MPFKKILFGVTKVNELIRQVQAYTAMVEGLKADKFRLQLTVRELREHNKRLEDQVAKQQQQLEDLVKGEDQPHDDW